MNVPARTALPLHALLCCLVLGLSGCPPDPAPEVTYEGEVKDILNKRCAGCHQADSIAPFTLSNYEQASNLSSVIAHSVEQGSMPPWMPDNPCNNYERDLSLSDEEREALLDWAAIGAPQGESGNNDDAGAQTATEIRVDTEISMPESYSPQVSPDDYRCFLMDWNQDRPKYVTGFKVVPGSAQIVHHVIAFVVNPSGVDDFIAMDEADDGPGYTCFGSPVVGPQSVSSATRWRWLASWTPGSGARPMPTGTGIAIQPGSKIVVQLHYNTLEDEPIEDQTRLQLQLEDEVDRPALVLPLTNYRWLSGSESMLIPAGSPDTVHSMSADLSENVLGFLGGTIGLSTGDSFQMHSIGLHMHLLGSSGRSWIERADGKQQCLLDIPRWDFNWQGAYEFTEPVTVHPGDRFNLECQWDNSAGNQSPINGEIPEPQDIEWGDGTRSEMCLAIAYVTAL